MRMYTYPARKPIELLNEILMRGKEHKKAVGIAYERSARKHIRTVLVNAYIHCSNEGGIPCLILPGLALNVRLKRKQREGDACFIIVVAVEV